jgi:SAM-dependent methyltransferase
VSEIYDKYLTVEQQKKIKKFPDERRWNNYRNFDLEIEVWDHFWNDVFKWEDDTKPTVLDYGCGAAYDEHVATTLEKADVTSLDIDTKEVRIVFGRFHEIIGVEATYWDGKTIPFDDNSFDAIISKASLSKLVNSSWSVAMSELARVTKPNGVWYVAPHYMADRLVENVPEEVKQTLIDKSVNFCSWTWDVEDSRNRYWRNKGINTKDAQMGHDINYEDRESIGEHVEPMVEEDDE